MSSCSFINMVASMRPGVTRKETKLMRPYVCSTHRSTPAMLINMLLVLVLLGCTRPAAADILSHVPSGVVGTTTSASTSSGTQPPGNTTLERLLNEVLAKLPRPKTVQSSVIYKYPSYDYIVRIQQLVCVRTILCYTNISISNSFPICCGNCSCDESTCFLTGTCCPDLLLKNFGEFPPALRTQQKCMPMHIGATPDNFGRYAVRNCPLGTNAILSNKCSEEYMRTGIDDISDITPVYDATTKTTYRNEHCARCNAINLVDLNYFDVSFACFNMSETELIDNNAILDMVFNSIQNECHLSFKTKVDCNCNASPCNHGYNCMTTVSACNETGYWHDYDPDIENACHGYTSVYFTEYHGVFNNIFCYICNGYSYSPYTQFCDHGSDFFSFSGLFNVDNYNKDTEGQQIQMVHNLFLIT